MIELTGVSFAYDPTHPVLAGLDLSIRPGLTLLLGPNGCGKSTLLKIAAGVERPDAGVVTIDGHDLWRDEVAARRELAYVPEQPDLSPYASVLEILRLVCRLRVQPLACAEEALQGVGLAGYEGRSVRELSMGQRKRAVLAAALIGTPCIALLDEPLETLDRGARATVIDWIRELLSQGATVVVVTHDLEPFAESAGCAIALSAGTACVCEPLPEDPADRLALLERYARDSGSGALAGDGVSRS
jgi:ABC-type multidrug transport system ATPase subunit